MYNTGQPVMLETPELNMIDDGLREDEAAEGGVLQDVHEPGHDVRVGQDVVGNVAG